MSKPKDPFARVVPRGWIVVRELAERYDAQRPGVQAARGKAAERDRHKLANRLAP